LIWVSFELAQKIKLVEQSKHWIQPAFYISAFVVLTALVVYVRPWSAGNLASTNLDLVTVYANYVSTAKLMNDMDVDSPIIIGAPDATVNAIIPSLTHKFVPLVFRVQSGGAQTKVWKSLVGDDISPADRLARLQENHVEYMLIRGEPAWLPEFKENYPDSVLLIFKDQRFSLYQLKP
jgi:hypothetical protein